MQSVVETNCIHAIKLGVVVLLLLVLLGQERFDLADGEFEVLDEHVGVRDMASLLPPRVERLVGMREHGADFESDQRHERGHVTDFVVLATILLHAGDAILVRPVLVVVVRLVVEALLRDSRQDIDGFAVTREDLGLDIIHAVIAVSAVGANAQHDGHRAGVREHRFVESERRRSVVGFVRVVVDVAVNGQRLAVGMSVAHGVGVWFWFRLRIMPCQSLARSLAPAN